MRCTECEMVYGHKMDCSQGRIMAGRMQWTSLLPTGARPEPPRQPQSVPLVAGSVIGIRAWRGDGHSLWPVAVHGAPPWQQGENVSICVATSSRTGGCGDPDCTACHPRPRHTFDAACTCGFYAVFHERHVPSGDFCRVTGVVEGYGRMIVGPGGFRASKARVLALAYRPEPRENILPSMWRSTPLFDSLKDAVAEFPVTDPTPYLS